MSEKRQNAIYDKIAKEFPKLKPGQLVKISGVKSDPLFASFIDAVTGEALRFRLPPPKNFLLATFLGTDKEFSTPFTEAHQFDNTPYFFFVENRVLFDFCMRPIDYYLVIPIET